MTEDKYSQLKANWRNVALILLIVLLIYMAPTIAMYAGWIASGTTWETFLSEYRWW